MAKIAVNITGGDHAPHEIIKGAMSFAERYPEDRLILVGSDEALDGISEDEYGMPGETYDVVISNGRIGYEDEPAKAYRRSKDNPVRTCATLVKDGEADAMVDFGNTATALAAGTITIGRIKGVTRPALPVVFPRLGYDGSTLVTGETILLDVGANSECTPQMLAHFAMMGSIYAEIRGTVAPRIGLLTNGTEDSKGTQLVKDVDAILRDGTPGYVGKVEGRDLFSGEVDVVVTDGHNGNIVLKTVEGLAVMMGGFIIGSFFTSKEAESAYEVMRGPLRPLKSSLDPTAVGGVPLLGVDGVCIVGHGSSMATAVESGICVAKQAVEVDLVGRFKSGLPAHA